MLTSLAENNDSKKPDYVNIYSRKKPTLYKPPSREC